MRTTSSKNTMVCVPPHSMGNCARAASGCKAPLFSTVATRKACQTTSFLDARRAGVRLLLLLLVFQGLSSGRYPSSRAGQGTQGDGRSQCRLSNTARAEGQAYENRRLLASLDLLLQLLLCRAWRAI